MAEGALWGGGMLAFPGSNILHAVESFAENAAGYGYWAVMLVVAGDGVFPLLPGETAIVAAAVLAADGGLSLPLVILAGAVGAVIGDSTAYWIGRAGSGPIRRGIVRMAGEDRLIAAERMVRRHGRHCDRMGLPGSWVLLHVHQPAGGRAGIDPIEVDGRRQEIAQRVDVEGIELAGCEHPGQLIEEMVPG